MGLASVGWPNCGLPTTASMVANVTRLSTFVAARRHSSVQRLPSLNTRETLMSSENCAGPRIELRPALPQVPGTGVVNAAALAYEPGVVGALGMPVRVGRMPTTPVPSIGRNDTGVNGRPLPAAELRGDGPVLPERSPEAVHQCAAFQAHARRVLDLHLDPVPLVE